jgi:hypothetical protein
MFRDLRNDIQLLEAANKELTERSRALWIRIESSLDSVLDSISAAKPDQGIQPVALDAELRQLLKDRLIRPIYLDHSDEVGKYLDMQGKEWRHYGQVPLLRQLAPKVRAEVECRITREREEFDASKQKFAYRLNLILSGLERSIESNGRKRYRTPRSARFQDNSVSDRAMT